MAIRWPFLGVALLLQGCAIVTIEGEAKTSVLHLGVLRIEPAQGNRVLVYRTRGVGIVPGRSGMTIGAAEETAALIYAADDCRIILFQPRPEEAAALRASLADMGATPQTICILGEKKP
jgi:hypothetical protein